MKPKNDYQRNILRMSKALPSLTAKQEKWAMDNVYHNIGYWCKNSIWCTCCGHEWKRESGPLANELAETEVCPDCGKLLKVEKSHKARIENDRVYFCLTCVRGNFQVVRQFMIVKSIYRTSYYANKITYQRFPYYHIHEVVQNWIDLSENKPKITVIARPVNNMNGYYIDQWCFFKPMEIRSNVDDGKYRIGTDFYLPESRLHSKLRKLGLFLPFTAFSIPDAIKLLSKDEEAEILLKNRQISILGEKYRRGWGPYGGPYYHAVRIAIRHKHIVKDASMWFDYIQLLEYFGKDTHSPHYLFPKDLKAEHDRLTKKHDAIENKKAAERKQQEMLKHQSEYTESHGMYFGVCFGDDDVMVSVITSLQDMKAEGDAMGHCVFANGYYRRKDSLILTARDKVSGKRIETVELSLNTFKVVQSRGKFNEHTPMHKHIVSLVESNKDIFINIKNQQQTA